MQARQHLAALVLTEGYSVTAAAQACGVSRTTAHLWVQRARQEGVANLHERSRRPHRLRPATPPTVQEQVLQLKAQHPAWGGKKLHARLWPPPQKAPIGVRTVERLLARHGLTTARPQAEPAPATRFERGGCNELWQLDLKGLESQWGYYPLSVLDDHSRFCLALWPLTARTTEAIWAALWQVFGEFGLPECILCDNGDGFNCTAGHGPTLFQARLWRLGIRTTHGRPGHPQTQGKVERFHRTLETEWASALRQPSVAAAQAAWAQVRQEYNWQRPHEALGQRLPGVLYVPSPRVRPALLPEPLVPTGAILRKVDISGQFSYRGRSYRAGRGLVGERVEIRAEEAGEAVFYTGVRIAALETLRV